LAAYPPPPESSSFLAVLAVATLDLREGASGARCFFPLDHVLLPPRD
jgi:hypothetical protein